MTTNHTPGPWAVRFTEQSNVIQIVAHDVGAVIARTAEAHPESGIYSDIEHNARLIAAAPELLAALDDLVQQIDKGAKAGRLDLTVIFTTEARAAIARARGEA